MHEPDGGHPEGAQAGQGEGGDRGGGGRPPGCRGAERRVLFGVPGSVSAKPPSLETATDTERTWSKNGSARLPVSSRGGDGVLLHRSSSDSSPNGKPSRVPAPSPSVRSPSQLDLPGTDRKAPENPPVPIARRAPRTTRGRNARQFQAVGEVELGAVEQGCPRKPCCHRGVGGSSSPLKDSRAPLASTTKPVLPTMNGGAGEKRTVQLEADAAGAVEHHRPGLERDRERQRVAVGIELRLPRPARR